MIAVEVARTASDTSDPISGLRAVASLRRVADMLDLTRTTSA
ncbi:MAG: hypothetical protein QM619_04145 [Micropruina sp.]